MSTMEMLPQYKSEPGIFGDMVCFHQGNVDSMGRPEETRLIKKACLLAIETIEGKRTSYATQEAFDRNLNLYLGAARFMGWIE